MNINKYQLQRYTGINSRHTCPNCGHPREFALYVDENGNPIDESCGRCNREKCGYHLPPSEFFKEHPGKKKTDITKRVQPKQTEVKETDPWSKKQKSNKKTEKIVAQIPRIVVFNKIDAFTYTPKEEDDLTPIKRENISLEELQRTWMSKLHDDCIFISARQKTNIDELKALFYDRIKAIHIQRYPYNDFLFQQYE